MGEYATNRKGNQIKIGTCESMYWLRWSQRDQVKPDAHSLNPADVADRLRFRFPWPDEDGIEAGEFENPDRKLPIDGYVIPADVDHRNVQFTSTKGYNLVIPCPEGHPEAVTVSGEPVKIHRNGFAGSVFLSATRWRPSIGLVPVLECACGAMWREEGRPEIEAIAAALRAMADRFEQRNQTGHARLYHACADRVLAGIGTDPAALAMGHGEAATL
jgi:hypothetical protein